MQAGTRSGMSLDPTTALEGALQVDINELLLRTDGSAIECECTAAYMHDPSDGRSGFPQPRTWEWVPQACPLVRSSCHQRRCSCAQDMQSPDKFLERLENSPMTRVAADTRLTQVVPVALDGGAKL